MPEYQQTTSEDWFDTILENAIEDRASDIHFEPERDAFNVRFRIDGLLHVYQSLENLTQDSIISRIKVLAKMDITDKRLPQDGHFEFKHQDIIYNIRVSTLPTTYGETIVFRILNRDEVLINLENLGFTPDQLDLVTKLITNSSGLILTTGPTGSGKTNLLYSILHSLNKPDVNIITLEDPIEYQMANMRQVQIEESIGLTFAKTMRSVVRQDPDIIMLGEIRDNESAQMAMQVSLAGILMFSTFHTFDVPALVSRFEEMGITKSIIAQAIKGVISTRLVRKICQFCKIAYMPTDGEKRMLGALSTNVNFQKGKGCEKCNNTGYLGRVGIYEIVYFDEQLQAAILENVKASQLHEFLTSRHVKSLRQSAYEKVLQGITTMDEVIRVLGILPT